MNTGLPINVFDKTGLYGQSVEAALELDRFTQEINGLMVKVSENLGSVSGIGGEFEGLFKSRKKNFLIGWKLDDIFFPSSNSRPEVFPLWSMNLGDNRNLNLLWLDNKKLVIATSEYFYQSAHASGFHWYRRHDASVNNIGIAHDSYRLLLALRVLANPDLLRRHLLAKIELMKGD